MSVDLINLAFQFNAYLESVVNDLESSTDKQLLMINNMLHQFEHSFLIEQDFAARGFVI